MPAFQTEVAPLAADDGPARRTPASSASVRTGAQGDLHHPRRWLPGSGRRDEALDGRSSCTCLFLRAGDARRVRPVVGAATARAAERLASLAGLLRVAAGRRTGLRPPRRDEEAGVLCPVEASGCCPTSTPLSSAAARGTACSRPGWRAGALAVGPGRQLPGAPGRRRVAGVWHQRRSGRRIDGDGRTASTAVQGTARRARGAGRAARRDPRGRGGAHDRRGDRRPARVSTTGSASNSISRTRPSTTVNPNTTLHPCPCAASTRRRSRRALRAARPGPPREELRHLLSAVTVPASDPSRRRGIGADDGVRVQQLQQRLELVVARGLHEGVDHCGVGGGQVLTRLGLLQPPPRTAGEAGSRPPNGPAPGRSLERHREHVLQHVGQPLGRGQRVEDDRHRLPDGVDELGPPPPGVSALSTKSASSGQASSRFVVRLRSTSRQIRETTVVSQPGRLPIFSPRLVGADQPEPGLLYGVVGSVRRCSASAGRSRAAGSLGLERSARHDLVGHPSHPPRWPSPRVDEPPAPNVTKRLGPGGPRPHLRG